MIGLPSAVPGSSPASYTRPTCIDWLYISLYVHSTAVVHTAAHFIARGIGVARGCSGDDDDDDDEWICITRHK